MRRSVVTRTFNLLFLGLFLGFIYSSPLNMFFSERQLWSDAEKRSLALFPPWTGKLYQASDFFVSVNEYIDDHFGFREFYIHRYQREILKLFNKTSDKSIVIKGLCNWYFLNKFGLIEDFFGRTPLNKNQLGNWLEFQEKKHSWLSEHNIRYQYMAIPNKQSIYPQYLMKNGLHLKGTSRFEQLLEYTDNNLPDYILNLHDLLRPELYEKPLYYKNDSHWNKLAAYAVFRRIMENVAEWFPDEQLMTNFQFSPDETGRGGNTGRGGDLVKILMQPDLQETYPQTKRFKRCAKYNHLPYKLSNLSQSPGRRSFVRKCSKRNLNAVIFRDSFFVPLEPFISENFEEVVYLWKEYDQKNIEEIMAFFKPDIVIEAIAERHVFDSLLETEKHHQGTSNSAVATGQ